MGYRSMVYIKIGIELIEDFEELLRQHDIDYIDKVAIEGKYCKYVGEDLKWYEGYKEVNRVQDFINDNEENSALIAIGMPSELDMFIVMEIQW